MVPLILGANGDGDDDIGGLFAGTTLALIHLPGTLHELKTEIQRLHEAHLVPENL